MSHSCLSFIFHLSCFHFTHNSATVALKSNLNYHLYPNEWLNLQEAYIINTCIQERTGVENSPRNIFNNLSGITRSQYWLIAGARHSFGGFACLQKNSSKFCEKWQLQVSSTSTKQIMVRRPAHQFHLLENNVWFKRLHLFKLDQDTLETLEVVGMHKHC